MTFDQTWYGVGTASVSNGSLAVTGQGSNWLSGGIIAGDFFIAAGEIVPIATVNSNTSITLTDAWPGTTRATDSYKIIPASDSVRVLVAARAVLSLLTGGNVNALAGLTLAANKGLYGTGVGALATYDLTAFGRAIQGLTGANGGIIRATGAGTAVMQAILGAVSQSGGVPTGALMETGANANGQFMRFANGLQICQISEVPINVATAATQAKAMPANFSSSSRWSTFITHCSTNPNAALIHSNIRFTFQDSVNFALRLNTPGTSADPASLEEKINITSIGRWY